MNTPRYLRFVKALVLTAAVPACSSDPTTEPPPAKTADSSETAPATEPPATPGAGSKIAEAKADAGSTADADVDSGLPFSSGPIVPPELPVGFA